MTRVPVAMILAVLVMTSASAWSHPLAPSLLEVREIAPARAEVRWKRPISASDAMQPMLPAGCRALGPAAVQADDVAVTVGMQIECGGALTGRDFGVSGLAGSRTDVLLRVALLDGRVLHQVLRPDLATFRIPQEPGTLAVSSSYFRLGFGHVLGGADHLLFLLGLLLLASGRRRLITMVTAFTAGHSVTLSLAAVVSISLPAAPIEALIAASILVLACELARLPTAGATLLQRHPAILTFGFGLLHGLGFAGALRETGLPKGEVALALFGFNLGIEAGQLAFVVGLLLLTRVVPQRQRRESFGRIATYAIGSVAACLCIERTFALLG